jgi:hypothetical protein
MGAGGVALVLALSSTIVTAADRTWTGAGSTSNMSDAANWQGGAIPVTGDHLIFPGTVAKKTVNNDLSGVNILGIEVTGAVEYDLGGNTWSFLPTNGPSWLQFDMPTTPGGTVPGGTLEFHAPVHLPGGLGTEVVASGTGIVHFWNGVTTDPTAVIADDDYGGPTLMFMSPVVAAGSINFHADATFSSTGNVFPAGLDLAAGSVHIVQGAIPNGTRLTVGDYATLYVDDVHVTTGDFSCRGYVAFNVGTGSIKVQGSGSMYHCNLALQVSSTTPAPVNGQYLLIQDAGASAFDVQYPNPGESAAVIVNSVPTTVTYLGGTSGRDVTLKQVPSTGPPNASLGPVDFYYSFGRPLSTAAYQVAKFSFGASVNNKFGPVQGAMLNFTIAPGCGTFSNGKSSIDVFTGGMGGASTGVFTAGAPGNCSVTITLVGTATTGTQDYIVWDPATLRVIPANASMAFAPGQTFNDGMTVKVVDAGGHPAIGAQLIFSPAHACGGFYRNETGLATTDVTGTATSPPYTAPIVQADCFIDVIGNPDQSDYDYDEFSSLDGKIEVRVTTGPASFQVQDMWWSGPVSENGWGMSVIQHGDTLFTVFYIYDSQGSPTWYVMPGGTWDLTHTSYYGNVYLPKGSPFYAYDTSKFSAQAPAGTAQITFNDLDHAQVYLGVGTQSQFKTVVRQVFGPVEPFIAGLGDLWWGGTSQNGWGISVIQHYATLFIVWYTYDDTGMPRWYVMPGGTWTASDTYEGQIYHTIGTPWFQGPYSESDLKVFDAGPYKLRFTGTTATLDYTIDSHTGTLQLQHEPF